ncbi:HalOD1 output domain-containing protein [Natronococcus sp.]|uniref:HalOD1 output domain-containing protein n=1 Tax=Natronococcus sp. TaxID=35747 RepID=UPI003742EDAE
MEYEIGVDESVATAIVRAVSAVEGRQPGSMPPLTHVINPDALDALFDSRSNGEPRIGGRFSLVYSRCRVTVDNGEYLTVQLLEDCPRVTDGRDRDRTELQ